MNRLAGMLRLRNQQGNVGIIVQILRVGRQAADMQHETEIVGVDRKRHHGQMHVLVPIPGCQRRGTVLLKQLTQHL